VSESLVRVPRVHIVGPSVRTTNADEASGKGKIGGLWQRFFAQDLASRIPARAHPTRVYGVYTDYESDHTGPYTLVVGCPVVTPPSSLPEGMVSVTVPEGDYLAFAARGAMPRALIDTWGRIWGHFESASRQRSFTTDFELHDSETPSEVQIHIALGRERISSGSPFESKIGFSRAVRVGDRVLVSGTAPIWPDGSCDPDPEAQARRCLEIIAAALKEAGAAPRHVVRTRMFLTSAKDADAVGRAHAAFFGKVRPAATMVVVAGLLDPRWKVEIEAEAVTGA
jgi:predicted transcriptional regulator YdeE